MNMSPADPKAVIAFWFEELSPADWFQQSDEVDKRIRDRFQPLLERAAKAELADWRVDILGRLAEIIVLDQFPRNIFRGSARAFATDTMALVLSQEAILQPDLDALAPTQTAFLLMPFMHSESKAIHEQAMVLFDQPGLENNLEFERQHKEIIDQFGRYPHRNEVLGRESTPGELTYLAAGNRGF